MDEGLFSWPNLSGETQLCNKEEEAYKKETVNLGQKHFIGLASGVNLIKLFQHKLFTIIKWSG
jgi:hypothetical protein